MDFSNQLFAYDNLFSDEQLDIPAAKIFQVSELSIVSGGEIVTHTQQCDEITFVVSGSGTVFSENKADHLCTSQVHYIKKGCIHQILADKNENLRFICIGFTVNENHNIFKMYNSTFENKRYCTVSDNRSIKTLSELLIREFYAWDEHSIDSVNRYMEQIIVALCRILSGQSGSPQGELYEKNSSNLIVYRTLRYIDREYIHLKSVQEIISALSYSDSYLSHLFKEKVGISLKSYLMQKKIAHAIELLKTSRLSIEEIATYLNFSSAHSFRRAFKLHTGQVPSQIQNQKAENVPY